MDKNLKIALLLTANDKASSVMGRAFTSMEHHAKRLSRTGKEFGEVGEKAMLAGAIITGALGETVLAADEAAKAQRKLQAAFANVGKQGKELAASAKEFAEGYQLKIGVKDDEIEAVQAKFAVFHKMFSESSQQAHIFERATRAAYDMQALGFGDAAQNAVKLGRLLNDPINNANALGKVLGKLNAKDKERVASLIAQNKGAEAQNYLLTLVERKFKNAGETIASPLDKAKVGIHAVSVSIGEALLPAVNRMLTKFSAYLPKAIAFAHAHSGMIKTIAKLGIGLLAFGATFKVIGSFMGAISTAIKVTTMLGKAIEIVGFTVSVVGKLLMANPIILIITAIAAAAFLIYKYWTPITNFFSDLWDSVSSVFANTWDWIKTMFLNYTPEGIIISHWKPITQWFANLWQGVKNVFNYSWQGIKKLFFNFTPLGILLSHWKPITGWFSHLWDNVKNVFSDAWKWIVSLGTKFYDAGKNIVSSVWRGMKEMAMKPVELMAGITKKIRDYLPFSPAKAGALRDIHRVRIVETIAKGIKAGPLVNAMQNATGRLYNSMNQTVPAYASGSSTSNQIHFSPTINLSGGATQRDGEMISSKLKAEFERMMRDYQQRNDRKSFN